MRNGQMANFNSLRFERETYQIIGAAIEVAKNLGPGFLESVYQEALAYELRKQRIPHIAQKQIRVSYKGKVLDKSFVADFLCFDTVIVELKAIREISRREEAQLLNYLKAAHCEVGLILNFGSRRLTWKRMIHSSW
jgi:GxxExxY protein